MTNMYQLTLTQKEAELLCFAWGIPCAAITAKPMVPFMLKSLLQRIAASKESTDATKTLTEKFDKIAEQLESEGVK